MPTRERDIRRIGPRGTEIGACAWSEFRVGIRAHPTRLAHINRGMTGSTTLGGLLPPPAGSGCRNQLLGGYQHAVGIGINPCAGGDRHAGDRDADIALPYPFADAALRV